MLRRVAEGNRARHIQFWRFLHNDAVTVSEMAEHASACTGERVSGRDVLAIQDSSELCFGGQRARDRGFGPVGQGGQIGGLLLHAMLAVDADDGALLGLVDMQIFNRVGERPAHRRRRTTADKESQRWLDGMQNAAATLQTARRITVVADRESDIYEEFATRPPHVHLITRAGQNRRAECDGSDGLLFELADGMPERGRFYVTIPAAPGRKARQAELALRYSRVSLRKPVHCHSKALPDAVVLTLVDVREVRKPAQGERVHWRLLTTHCVESLPQARMVLDFYRKRWIIEDYFRTLKTAGVNVEDADIEDPKSMERFVGAAAIAAVKILQLVRARDGTDQVIADAFDPEDRSLLETVSKRLEGRTARQKNPHPKGTLAFAAWVIARLGSWDGYYGKPGPKVMRIGLQAFQHIKYGHSLERKDV